MNVIDYPVFGAATPIERKNVAVPYNQQLAGSERWCPIARQNDQTLSVSSFPCGNLSIRLL